LETQVSLRPLSPQLNNEKKSSGLVLPVIYRPEEEKSPRLEIISHSPMDKTTMQLILVEKSKPRVYETIV